MDRCLTVQAKKHAQMHPLAASLFGPPQHPKYDTRIVSRPFGGIDQRNTWRVEFFHVRSGFPLYGQCQYVT
jgi:hypothetical protein